MYCGRLAPSPTGPLHFGSLVAALASYLEAKHNKGRWLIRIEDVDGPRTKPGAAAAILSTLSALGFRSDGSVVYQSERKLLYRQALDRLQTLTYPCCCSRKEIGEFGEGRYPGTCRPGMLAGKPLRAIRLHVDSKEICFDDAIQGTYCSRLDKDLGDFSLFRPDTGIFSYHLAVVVDDEAQGVTDIVRGADLLDSTPRQIYLQRALGYRTPRYLHIPVATGPDGEKLSKQNLAPAIQPSEATKLLFDALVFLGQDPPVGLADQDLEHVWNWASLNWNCQKIPVCQARPTTGLLFQPRQDLP